MLTFARKRYSPWPEPARKLTGLSGKEIAESFGVTAARVSQLVNQVEESEEPKQRRRIERLRERLSGGGS